MSWRHLVNAAQKVILRTFAERDTAGGLTTEVSEDGTTWVEIRAIFDDGHLEVALEGLQTVASVREIRADVAISELPAYPPLPAWRFRIRRPLEGDPLETSGTAVFEIVDHRPDGQGLVRLILRTEEPAE